MLDLWSRRSVATLYEFKIIIDVPKVLTWRISESAQIIRWKAEDQNLDPSRTVFLSPLRKRLPMECPGHWKKVSNQRILFGTRRKILTFTLAIYPIHDKDSQSAKNKGDLSESHLWEVLNQNLCGWIQFNVCWPGIVTALVRYDKMVWRMKVHKLYFSVGKMWRRRRQRFTLWAAFAWDPCCHSRCHFPHLVSFFS